MPQAGLLEQSLFNRFFSQSYKPMPFPLVPANRLDQHPERRRRINEILLNHEPAILDIKGWLNQSSLSFGFWSLLLHTPWWECADRQRLKPPVPPQSPT